MNAALAKSPNVSKMASAVAMQPINVLREPSLASLCARSILSGGLLWLCFFPMNWGWAGWFALAPLLGLVRAQSSWRKLFLASWVGGLVFCIPAFQWMRVADPRMYFTWIGLAIYCSLYFPAALFGIRFLESRTRLPLLFSVPVVWTALEFLRAHFATGFAWYFLAHTQHDFLPVIQISDLGGAYVVTFLVALVNAYFVQILIFNHRGILKLAWHTAFVVGLVGGALAYGYHRLNQIDFKEGPKVALIQGNLEQGVKNDSDSPNKSKREKALESVNEHYSRLLGLAADKKPDLIVLPETSYARDWVEFDSDFPFESLPRQWQEQFDSQKTVVIHGMPIWQYLAIVKWNKPILDEARAAGANVLFGLNGSIQEPGEHMHRLNSAVLVDAEGEPGKRYDKIHRVPFGEYVPLREWIPAMNYLAPYDHDYSVQAGKSFTRFPLKGWQFGVVICFEDTDPQLALNYVSGHAQDNVDFLLNISNDGWFKGTAEHEQHLAISRFRAIECRRTLARAVNMGISAIIDPNGRVLRPDTNQEFGHEDHGKTLIWRIDDRMHSIMELGTNQWSAFKRTSGVLLGTLPIDQRSSLYAHWGDWLPWCCWIILALALTKGCFRPAKKVIPQP